MPLGFHYLCGMPVRIDKWLWAVRIFKTRTLAADACKSSRVTVNGTAAKPSRDIAEGNIITVRKGAVTYTLRVLGLANNRQPAKDVPLFMENITPVEELAKLQPNNVTIFVQRDRGTGRPTKKERRDIDGLMEEFLYEE